MAIRDDLLVALTSRLAAYNNFKVSTEFPYQVDGTQPLYLKNLRTVYADQGQPEVVDLFRTLNYDVLDITTTTVNVYFAHDAKNAPVNTANVITACLLAKNNVNCIDSTVSVETEMENDVLTYTFEYNFTTV